MNVLRQIASEYDRHASRIATAEWSKRDGGALLPQYEAAVKYYREAGDAVRALIRPEDEESNESEWNLAAEEKAAAFKARVTAADKAATPQELLKKANQ
jgi:hypothetical protein